MEKNTKVVIGLALVTAAVAGVVVAVNSAQAAPAPQPIQWKVIDLQWS